jgi:hypothetical protein
MLEQESPRRTPQRQISQQRKALYYVGNGVAIFGLLLFLSTFLSAALSFGDRPNFREFRAQGQSMALRAFGGMILMIAGGSVARIGKAGAAGSGLKLDPEQARRDVEPWSRMTGGVVGDVLDEAGIKLGAGAGKPVDSELPFDEKLRRLHKLHEDGILTDEEYRREKQELLDSN